LLEERDLPQDRKPGLSGRAPRRLQEPGPCSEEHRRKRGELLDATEQDLKDIQARILRQRQPSRAADKIGIGGRRLTGAPQGRQALPYHHHRWLLRAAYRRSSHILNASDTVRAYKSLARVERAFSSLTTVDLEIRPIFHWLSPRVRAHVFLCICMLAYHLEWHTPQAPKG
jgi:transposase